MSDQAFDGTAGEAHAARAETSSAARAEIVPATKRSRPNEPLSAQDLDDIKARNPLADIAGGYVKLRRMGKRLVGPCPICGGKATSQRFEILEDGESWVCAVCPDGGDVIRTGLRRSRAATSRGAIERLGGQREIDARRRPKSCSRRARKSGSSGKRPRPDFREAERKRLYKDVAGRREIHDTIGRSLPRAAAWCCRRLPGPALSPSAPYWHGEQLDERGRKSPIKILHGPGDAGGLHPPDGKFGGLHMTWLRRRMPPADQSRDHDPESGEVLNAKKMRGSKTGAHIAIAPAKDARRLIVGEGIETVLAVYGPRTRLAGRDRSSDIAFWAAGDLGNMAGRATETVRHPTLKRPNGHPHARARARAGSGRQAGLSIPDSVEELILLGDGDSGRADAIRHDCEQLGATSGRAAPSGSRSRRRGWISTMCCGVRHERNMGSVPRRVEGDERDRSKQAARHALGAGLRQAAEARR
jgi:hypothetical protein